MENEKRTDELGTAFWKWLAGIALGVVSFFLIKVSNKLDKMEDMLNEGNKTSAVQEMRIQSNKDKIDDVKGIQAEHATRISRLEEKVGKLENK